MKGEDVTVESVADGFSQITDMSQAEFVSDIQASTMSFLAAK